MSTVSIDKHQTILFPVLNWGLGHATRSLPIIQHLLDKGKKVIIASDGNVLLFFKEELKDSCLYEELPSTSVKYSISPKIGTLLHIPKLLLSTIKEKRITERLILKHSVDCIISDNRYGCYSQRIPSYLICHQLNPFVFIKLPFIQNCFAKRYANLLNNFDACLIPDFYESQSIAGDLARNKYVTIPQTRIGLLTSKQKIEKTADRHILIVLSGPEPNRSILERNLITKLKDLEVTIVTGAMKLDVNLYPNNWAVIGQASGKEISQLMANHEIVITRSGYSSVMDVLALGKKAVFIPTKGQPEQEFIAQNINSRKGYSIVDESCESIESTIKLLTKIVNPKPLKANNLNAFF